MSAWPIPKPDTAARQAQQLIPTPCAGIMTIFAAGFTVADDELIPVFSFPEPPLLDCPGSGSNYASLLVVINQIVAFFS